MNKKKLSVLIVGCGNIAGHFDENIKKTSLPFTHAGAYQRDGRFHLCACVDPDEIRRKKFMDFWGVKNGFSTIEEIPADIDSFDVISICSPSHSHFKDLQAALRLQPKLIFCEKPVTCSTKETQQVIAECERLNILLAVNYTRSWDPAFRIVKTDMKAGKWGELRSIVGYYNKGILNNGSHLIDLLYFFVDSLNVISSGQAIFDFFADDPTIPAFLEGPDGMPIHLVTNHVSDYTLFELQLIFSQGVLTMEQSGMTWRERRVEKNPVFKGYWRLGEGHIYLGSGDQAMLLAVDNIFNAIKKREPLAKTGWEALKVQKMCELIKKRSLENGRCNDKTG